MARSHRQRGAASLVVIAASMLIVLVLVVLYMKSFLPSGPKGGPSGSALEAAKRQAQNFEEKQRERLEEMNRLEP